MGFMHVTLSIATSERNKGKVERLVAIRGEFFTTTSRCSDQKSRAMLAPLLLRNEAVVPERRTRELVTASVSMQEQLSGLQLVHIPKAGGTSLEDFGKNRLGVKWGYYREDWPGGRCPYGCEGPASWHSHAPLGTSRARCSLLWTQPVRTLRALADCSVGGVHKLTHRPPPPPKGDASSRGGPSPPP